MSMLPQSVACPPGSGVRPGRQVEHPGPTERLGVPVARDDVRVARLPNAVKDKEAQGYAYEVGCRFELCAARASAACPTFSMSIGSVSTSSAGTTPKASWKLSEATVRVTIDGQTRSPPPRATARSMRFTGPCARISAISEDHRRDRAARLQGPRLPGGGDARPGC